MSKTFNYESQQWEQDEDGVKRKAQLQEEYDLLCSDRGEDYAQMLGLNRATTIRNLKRELGLN